MRNFSDTVEMHKSTYINALFNLHDCTFKKITIDTDTLAKKTHQDMTKLKEGFDKMKSKSVLRKVLRNLFKRA